VSRVLEERYYTNTRTIEDWFMVMHSDALDRASRQPLTSKGKHTSQVEFTHRLG
jgi:hypothetical protein